MDLIAAHKDIQVFVREHRSATFAEKHLTPLGIETHLWVTSLLFRLLQRRFLGSLRFSGSAGSLIVPS